MKNVQYVVVHRNNLVEQLGKLSSSNPNRLHGNLDLLKKNLSKNMHDILQWNGDKWIFEVNHFKREITVLWDPLNGAYITIWYYWILDTKVGKFYEQFMWAIHEAKDLWIEKEIFQYLQSNAKKRA